MQRVQPVITFLSVERSCLLFAFSSFQDPVDPASTVIVIRSLVPGGIAEKDGTPSNQTNKKDFLLLSSLSQERLSRYASKK